MVKTQIIARGIKDPTVIQVLERLPRHLFVAPQLQSQAYDDKPLPIGLGQTISQPYIVACMTELCQLNSKTRILEVGTGCGYQTAVLAEICAQVYTIEIVPSLLKQAERRLRELGYSNIHFHVGDGSLGWPDSSETPFDAILSAAAPPQMPLGLLKQVRKGGIMVIPIGESRQQLLKIEKKAAGIKKRAVIPVRFVPMIESQP